MFESIFVAYIIPLVFLWIVAYKTKVTQLKKGYVLASLVPIVNLFLLVEFLYILVQTFVSARIKRGEK